MDGAAAEQQLSYGLLRGAEIANALLAQGTEEGKAIRIAIAKAKQWVTRHGFLSNSRE